MLGREGEVQRLGAQRAVQERFLFALSFCYDLIAHLSEQEIDLKAGFLDVIEQGRCERAVSGCAVQRRGAAFCGICNEHVSLWLDIGEALAGPARAANGAGHMSDERIVTAGVEYHEPKLGRSVHLGLYLSEGHRLVCNVCIS